ncbi:MAG: DUF192 domain-containing protein [Bacteroidales bacterium]|nr:DUF192 domain-containing protein [Bacteroidales bacterium]MDD4217937.1 DUF192 domain-containing protein [Bacteroidales bacterium]
MKIIIIYTTIIFLSIMLVQCNNDKKKKPHTKTNNVELKQKNYSYENPPVFRNDGELVFIDNSSDTQIFQINIEVASTDFERALGLMYRAQMEEEQGMLFLFPREQEQSFYMRNTLISLDIIYVNSKMQIVDIYKNTSPLNETSLPSAERAQYVIEINGGLCDKYEIEVGDKVIF